MSTIVTRAAIDHAEEIPGHLESLRQAFGSDPGRYLVLQSLGGIKFDAQEPLLPVSGALIEAARFASPYDFPMVEVTVWGPGPKQEMHTIQTQQLTEVTVYLIEDMDQ